MDSVIDQADLRRLGAGTPPPDGCTSCYVYGVICALVGASLQAVGLQLWKLHYLREDERLEKQMAAHAVREHHRKAYRVVQRQGGGNPPLGATEPSTPAYDREKMAPDFDRSYSAESDLNGAQSFHQVIRHVRGHSRDSVNSVDSHHSGNSGVARKAALPDVDLESAQQNAYINGQTKEQELSFHEQSDLQEQEPLPPQRFAAPVPNGSRCAGFM